MLYYYYGRAANFSHTTARHASFFFGVRIMLGTIFGRFSIIYFRGLGLRLWFGLWLGLELGFGLGLVLCYGHGKFRVRVRIRVMVGVGLGL